LWQAVLITALGAIIGVLLALPFAAGFLPLGSAIGGAVVGLSVGLAWRRVDPPVSGGRVLALVGLWALTGGVAVVTGPGLFLIGGLLTGWILRRAQPATTRRDVVIIGLGWGLSWLLGGIIFAGATRLPSGPVAAALAAFGVALAGALSGWITFGRLRAARARTLAPAVGERPAPKFKWPIWAVVAGGLALLACAGVLVVIAVTTIRKTTADRAATQTAAAFVAAPTATPRPRAAATSAPVAAFECADALGCVDIAPGDPIHLAWIQVMSGETAPLGIDNVRGIEIALDDRNNTLLGHPIELTGEDSLCTPEGGEAASRVAADKSVVAIVGTSCSSEAIAAMPILSGAGLVMISSSNTNPDLTDPNSEHHWPGYLRTAPNDLFQGRVAADFAFNQLGVKKAATIWDGSAYSEALQQIFADAFRELGGEITAQEVVDPNATDMKPVLRQIASGAPELIFFPVYEPAGDYIAAQKCEVSGLKNTISMGADALLIYAMPQAAGRCAIGMYLTAPYVKGPEYDEFTAKYSAKYGEAPISGYHAHAYDAANMLLAAIEAVAVQDPDGALHIGRQALRDALYETKDFPGLTGRLTCDANGDCASDEAIGIYQITEAEAGGQWPPEVVWQPGAPDTAQPTRAPATRAPQPPSATATAAGAEATNWRVDYSYRFPENFWSAGTHQYTLVSNCPGLPPEESNSWTHSFEVSEGAAVLSGDVYLRLSGLRHEGAEVSTIHPSQPTLAQLSYAEMTRSDAEQHAAACTVTVSWDGGAPVTLTVGTPYQP
jgi:branched-chain amino acid transport system substrate-binding protein